MRRRTTKFTIDTSTNAFVMTDALTIDDIRLIVNETQNIVICSSMQKSNVSISGNSVIVNSDVCTLASGDHITFEIDKGDGIEDITSAIIGDDATATQTAIKTSVETLMKSVRTALTNNYSAHFEKNSDGDNTYTLILPLEAGIDTTTKTITV